jgi:hypothetical protein
MQGGHGLPPAEGARYATVSRTITNRSGHDVQCLRCDTDNGVWRAGASRHEKNTVETMLLDMAMSLHTRYEEQR